MVNVVIGLIGLGIVVFFHELGHLAAAKAVGIRVEAFSIGWGRKLISRQWGETEYRLSVFPFGGYCKMRGEEMLSTALEQDSPTIPKEHGSFYAAQPWKRILVVAAGPFMNVVFSVLVLSIVWFVGFTVQSFENRIILVSEYDQTVSEMPADMAGLETGDRIVAIDGSPVESYRDIQQSIVTRPNTELRLKVERRGQQRQLTVTPRLDSSTGAGQIGIYPWIEPVVGSVRDGSGAHLAGLQPGDRILAVNGQEVEHSIVLSQVLNEGRGPVELLVQRQDGGREELRVTPSERDNGDREIGVAFQSLSLPSPNLGPLGAVGRGFEETLRTTQLYIRSLALLFSGVDLQQAVAGPVRITYLVGEVATEGFAVGFLDGVVALFNFLSLLSIALFIMNLLPIPALDGGQILLFLFELIVRKELSPKLVYRYQMVGTVLILSLIGFALFSDILFLSGR
ncbi:MAG: RIP metalloprotease RseP [Spirochaetia bacterium]